MAVLLAVAISAGQWDKDTELLQEHADQISAYLTAQESDALTWAKENRSLLQSAAIGKQSGNWTNAVENQSLKDYTVAVIRGDSILVWLNNKVLPTPSQLKELSTEGRSLLALPAGYFAAYKEPLGSESLLVLTPIRFHIISAASGQKPFPAGSSIPGDIRISKTKTDYPVLLGGKDICWLEAGDNIHSSWLQWIKLVFYALFFIVLFGLINQFAIGLSQKYSPLAGAAVLLTVAGGIYFLNTRFGFTGNQFGNLPLFAQKFESPSLIGGSLGDWLVNIGLLAWLMVFFHRRFRAASLGNA
ncbi:MAG: hypothetical protein KA165_13660, partial [Saprospiraceae bacterium]|nr:hypothetical protein [Saprospiraceae bacterium]